MDSMKRRIDRLRKYLKVENLDAAFIFYPLDTGTFLPHVRFLTGFSGSSGALFVTRTKAFFITDSRYAEQSKTQVSGCTIVVSRKPPIAALEDIKEARGKNLKIAIESDSMTVGQKKTLAGVVPQAILVDTTEMVEELMLCKDSGEISQIKRAVAISDVAFERILGIVKPGLREKEIAAEMEYQMKMLGADKEAFATIVASGPRSALPHGIASEKKLKKGEFVTFDFGALYNGYCSDITRTVVLGKATSRQKRIYDIVARAQKAAIRKVRAGVTGKEVDKSARDIINRAGYGKNFGHGTGHGIGLQVHGGPKVSPMGTQALRSNMVITIEPGIYIAGWGGVRIEDDVVVRPKSGLVLNKAPKNLLEL
jgi:Xaa-Pro aminopeptidase